MLIQFYPWRPNASLSVMVLALGVGTACGGEADHRTGLSQSGGSGTALGGATSGGALNTSSGAAGIDGLSTGVDWPTATAGTSAAGGSSAKSSHFGMGGTSASGGSSELSTAKAIPLCNAPIFEGRAPGIEVGESPLQAVVGDWNHDGAMDIATISGHSDLMTVLLGKGDGTFYARRDYATGKAPSSIVAADLNSDGSLDLVTADYDEMSVGVFLGTGDGSFAPEVKYPIGAYSRSPTIVDWDRDGKLDLVAAGLLLSGQGDGTFKPARNLDGGLPALVDLNGDGILDAVNSGSSITTQLGKADGTLDSETVITKSGDLLTVALADFDADGVLDLVALQACNSPSPHYLMAFLGLGDGTFSLSSQWDSDCTTTITLGDVNADGKLDFMTGGNPRTGNSPGHLWLGNGDGTFVTDVGAATLQESFLGLSDLNGDGRLDLITNDSENDSMLRFWPNQGNGTWGHVPPIYRTGQAPSDILLADLNGDGAPDVVAVDPSDTAKLLAGNGDGTFLSPLEYSVPAGYKCVRAGDVNGDGKTDLVTVSGPHEGHSGLSLLLGGGDGTFAGTSIDTAGVSLSCPFAIGDLNGDRRADLVMYDARTPMSVLLSQGDGTFLPKAPHDTEEFAEFLAMGDLSGDGVLDLAVTNTQPPEFGVLVGLGDGTFAPKREYSSVGQPSNLVVGDLNHDGRADLVMRRNRQPFSISVRLGSMEGLSPSRADYALPANNDSPLALGDLHGDGHQDLAIAASGLIVVRAAADGTFTCLQPEYSGAPEAMAIGDVNRDGKLDLVVTFEDVDGVVVLLNSR